MKEAVLQALSHLKGQPLWAVGRAGSLEWFQFGPRRVVPTLRGGTKEVGQFALHLDCPWRLTGPRGELLPDHQSEPEVLAGLTSPSLLVCGVRAEESGGFDLEFVGGRRLRAEPDEMDRLEYWRLFQPGSGEPHFVMWPSGADSDG
jgi:hypothetical protein